MNFKVAVMPPPPVTESNVLFLKGFKGLLKPKIPFTNTIFLSLWTVAILLGSQQFSIMESVQRVQQSRGVLKPFPKHLSLQVCMKQAASTFLPFACSQREHKFQPKKKSL